MAEANTIQVSLSDYSVALLAKLQTDLDCDSRSELIEWLVLSQVHSAGDARALLQQRPKRGRRWPVVLPDDAILPSEG